MINAVSKRSLPSALRIPSEVALEANKAGVMWLPLSGQPSLIPPSAIKLTLKNNLPPQVKCYCGCPWPKSRCHVLYTPHFMSLYHSLYFPWIECFACCMIKEVNQILYTTIFEVCSSASKIKYFKNYYFNPTIIWQNKIEGNKCCLNNS